jgi:hypothetical protein
MFLNGGTRKKNKIKQEKFYNAWLLVVPLLFRYVTFLAYFRAALRSKICAHLWKTELGASVIDKT